MFNMLSMFFNNDQAVDHFIRELLSLVGVGAKQVQPSVLLSASREILCRGKDQHAYKNWNNWFGDQWEDSLVILNICFSMKQVGNFIKVGLMA